MLKKVITSIGKFTILSLQIIKLIFIPPFELKITINQMIEVGVRSLVVISLISLSTGMVLALQSGVSSEYVLGEPLYVGTVVSFSLLKTLAPLLTAAVITGRVGAAITAEIGTMKVTEQIDALYTLGTNPVKYLAVPRFIACLWMIPILTIYACGLGLIGGYIITVTRFGIPSPTYWADSFDYLKLKDFFHGLIKSFFFAMLIALISCYKGFECEGGAEGVGRATTSTVVTTIVLILISDFFLTSFLITIGIG